ncbi:MAG: ADP-ribosylglycohydrolase family protein [Candidatus Zipacnadales bacterium]
MLLALSDKGRQKADVEPLIIIDGTMAVCLGLSEGAVNNMRDRFEGAIMGLAVGDALGFPVEFISSDEIRRRYGPHGITDFVPSRFHPPGTYSDDTQMTLAVATALLRSGRETTERVIEAIAEALLAWAQSPENNRAPGSTTMSACRRLAAGHSWRESGITESKGCGSTIRTAPIGLYYHTDRERLLAVAANSSIITHGHCCAIAGSVANALAVSLAFTGETPEALFQAIIDAASEISDEFVNLLRQVPQTLHMAPDGAFDVLGDAWVAEEAIACALYCFLRSPDDYRTTVLTAANASGDSDSIACIAGGISGAYNGLSAIPPKWREEVETAEELLRVADALYEAALKS